MNLLQRFGSQFSFFAHPKGLSLCKFLPLEWRGLLMSTKLKKPTETSITRTVKMPNFILRSAPAGGRFFGACRWVRSQAGATFRAL
jgi:hypothetical protein